MSDTTTLKDIPISPPATLVFFHELLEFVDRRSEQLGIDVSLESRDLDKSGTISTTIIIKEKEDGVPTV